MPDVIGRFVKDIEWVRSELLQMDRLCNPVMGIKDWDDSVVVKFGSKKLVVSVDGPYNRRLVLKSALIHAATDVVVKGAKPLFALDTLIGRKGELVELVRSLKVQAEEMEIPLLGGNTLFEDVEPRCSLTVVGELIIPHPIRDCNARKGDVIALFGEPIWGEQSERITIARKFFKTWFKALKKVKINSSKDVTKGGLVCVIYEMEKKSGRKFKIIDGLKYPMTRNLDNFIITISKKEYEKLEKLCVKEKCMLEKIGVVL